MLNTFSQFQNFKIFFLETCGNVMCTIFEAKLKQLHIITNTKKLFLFSLIFKFFIYLLDYKPVANKQILSHRPRLIKLYLYQFLFAHIQIQRFRTSIKSFSSSLHIHLSFSLFLSIFPFVLCNSLFEVFGLL